MRRDPTVGRQTFAGIAGSARRAGVCAVFLAALAVGCTGSIVEPAGEASDPDGRERPDGSHTPGGRGDGVVTAGGAGSDTPPGTGGSPSAEGGTGPTTGSPEPVVCDDQEIPERLRLGTAPMRRLSSTEYLRTLSDLFPGVAPELPALPIEDPVDAFDNDARALGPSDVAVARWEEIAFRYTRDLTADAAALEAFLPCAASLTDRASAEACGAELVESFGLKTHRRPLTPEEQARYRALFEQQLEAIDFEAAVQLTAMAMLQSPWFLYRLELPDGEASGEVVALDSWQLASRLSYFLWQRMPDDELFDAARADRLTDPAELERQARRMLRDPRARDAVVDFHRQWLFFDRIRRAEHDSRVPELFPTWNAATQAAAHEELLRFVRRTVFDGDGTLAALLLSRETEVDASLAEIYGVEKPPRAGQWSPVTLPAGERAGFLTRVGFLAAHAHSANGSPPLRGAYVMQRLFCIRPGAPPPDADTSPPVVEGTDLTNRELFEQRAAPARCQGCHVIIDSFGFGFEHYDAIGAYREIDNGKPVDARVTLVGTDVTGEVDGAIELSEKLAQSTQVAECAVSRWFRYARGRAIEPVDRCVLERLNERFQQSGGDILELMVDLTLSPDFRYRPAAQE